jgi:anti-sigma regulatory factor (Ser/Thr protein kinase)
MSRRTWIALPVDRAAPATARRAVAGFDGLSATRVGDAQLVASELVTNALLHAGLRQDDTITLGLWRDGAWLRIEVDDHGGYDGRPAEERLGTESGGMGLRIVDVIATAWEASAGCVTAWITA